MIETLAGWLGYERRSYSDIVTSALLTAAAGGETTALETAALEACSGLYARCIAQADVTPSGRTSAVSAAFLSAVGRDLVRHGASVWLVDVVDGRLQLRPVASYEVSGNSAPESWRYGLTLAGPSGETTRTVPAASVLHFRWAVDALRPWAGVPPVRGDSAALASAVERTLGDEARSPAGYIVPVTEGLDTAALRGDLVSLRSRTAFVDTVRSGPDPQRVPARDWEAKRIGGDPPSSLLDLRRQAWDAVASACGVPAVLLSAGGDGSARREAYRLFLHTSIAPMGRLVTAELRSKLDMPDLKMSFDGLFASDLSGRARAFQSLVHGGMDVSQAAALAGLVGAE